MVGLQGAIERSYPQAKFQRCWVHLERNLYGYVRKGDRGDVVGEFKEIRKAKDLPAARQKLNDFIEHCKKRYKRVEKLAELSGFFTFYDFPEAIRSIIYTTNVIESFNSSSSVRLIRKSSFPMKMPWIGSFRHDADSDLQRSECVQNTPNPHWIYQL